MKKDSVLALLLTAVTAALRGHAGTIRKCNSAGLPVILASNGHSANLADGGSDGEAGLHGCGCSIARGSI